MTPFELVIIGAGPRAVCLVERLSANASEFLSHRSLVVHLVDPFTPGSGRIWRRDQSPLLRMNSRPDQVTLFPSEVVAMVGPPRRGLSLREWAELVGSGDLSIELEPDLRAELASLNANSFVTRRLQGAYLEWAYQEVRATLPAGISIREHRTKAIRLADGDPQQVWLAGYATPLAADAVVFSVGHGDGVPADHVEFKRQAGVNGLSYYPPGYTADTDYGDVSAGEKVLLRGMGLAFIDLVSLLTEGRGGGFEERSDGTLEYLPSGAEPILYAGSRRGVPYHAKILYSPLGKTPFVPRFFTNEAIDSLICQAKPLSFFADIWPRMAKEMAWGYYTELFPGHPDRTRGDFRAFSELFTESPWLSEKMHRLIEEFVPSKEDHLDVENLNNPLAGLLFPGVQEANGYVADYLRKNLIRRSDPYFSADLGANSALSSIVNHLPRLLASGRLDPLSQLPYVDSWWHNFYSYVSSGPPPRRLKELIALHEAGVLFFLGGGLRVEIDEESFVATSENSADRIRAKILIDARLPEACLRSTSDPLLRLLLNAGEISGEVAQSFEPTPMSSGRFLVRSEDSRVVDAEGRAHPVRFALGPDASDRLYSSFTKPDTDAPCFRQNDLVAREILTLAAKSVLEEFHCETRADGAVSTSP